MPRIIFKFLIVLVFFSVTLLSYRYSEATREDGREIISLDLSCDKGLVDLNNYLALSDKDILNYFAVRQRLYSLSYEELTSIFERSKKSDATKILNTLISDILSRKEKKNLFLLTEDILVDNIPLLADSPFYAGSGKSLKITQLKPYAEYIYLYNLKLKYKKNDLLKKTDSLWVNPKIVKEDKQGQAPLSSNPGFPTPWREKAVEIWSYKLKEDNLSDYFTDYFFLRQWIKKYEENAIYPVVYKGTVIMRNEHRLFCLDTFSGKETWSFGDIDKSGQEFYQAFRHPHRNSYGYEFLLAGDALFTEFAGKLVALRLNSALKPCLIWKRDLGEYTVCAKPMQIKDNLIVGLINARNEFWICGFNSGNGALKWSTYIGLSSFFSPVSTISTTRGDRVFIGTNHGVVACLDSNSGQIIWLRKYNPRKYSLLDFWLKDYYFKQTPSDAGNIGYDTQFIEIGDDGFLYYKPRESDCLYILDPKNGQTQDEIWIDTDRYYILRASNGRGIFLEKSIKTPELKIIELASGKQVYKLFLNKGSLKGVHYINREEMLFRFGDAVYFLGFNKDNISNFKIHVPQEGWLLNFHDRFLFLGKGRTLSCLDILNQTQGSFRRESHINKYFERRKRILDVLNRLLQLDAQDNQAPGLKKQILSDIPASGLTLDEIFPVIVANLEKLKDPIWREFIGQLQNLYGNEIINYHDIEIKFSNFLYKSGLLSAARTEGIKKIPSKIHIFQKRNFQVKTTRTTLAFLLPIEIIKGPKLLNFFLLLNRDQLICINENADILWARKVFYCPHRLSMFKSDATRGRMYTDDIQAYLYENTLIINDHVNILAVDVNDGTYIWSMTNTGELFQQERVYPSVSKDPLFTRYGVKRSFLRNIMLYANFLEGRLIITHGNKVYSVDPRTGFCERYRQLNIEAAIEVTVSDGQIYLLSYFLDCLEILDKELSIRGDFPLDFVDKRDKWPEMFLTDRDIVLHIDSDLYLLDRKDCALKKKINLGGQDRYYVEVFKENLLVIIPFEGVSGYQLNSDSLMPEWTANLEPVDQDIVWAADSFAKKSKYYFMINDQLLMPLRRGGIYFIVSIDAKTGAQLWERRLNGVYGQFFNLTDYQNIKGVIKFGLSTVCGGKCAEERELCMKSAAAPIVFLPADSKLISLNVRNGKITRIEQLPWEQTLYLLKADLIETANCFIYGFNGTLLKAEAK